MATVLIAEDEYLVRVGLRTCIDWESNGYRLLDDAVDGLDAYDKIRQYRPDILLLDIKMPRLDGLSLLKKLREEHDPIRVVILSCLDDFEHVRAALQYDVVDYMNKLTITPSELLKVLDKIPPSQESWSSDAGPAFSGDPVHPWSALKKILRKKSCEPAELKYIYDRGALLVITAAPHADGTAIAPHLLMTITSQQLKSNNIENITSYNENNSVVVLLPASADMPNVAATLFRQLNITLDSDCAIGISPFYKGTEQLYSAYCRALQIEEFRFWLRKGTVADYSEMPGEAEPYEDGTVLDQFRTAMNTGNLSVVLETVHEISEAFQADPEARREHYLRLLLAFLDLIPKKGLPKTYYSIQSEILQSASYLDAERALTSFMTAAYKDAGFSENDYSLIVSKAMRFITDHPNEVVTLARAAKQVNVSESYLSQLFKKETGQNFNAFVHHLKINQAKELLGEGLLIYEVCDRIGFDNANYFAKLFRRYTGFSPNEFKRKNRS